LRGNDHKFAAAFDDVAAGAGIRVVHTPVLAPKAAAFVERFIGSLRRECLASPRKSGSVDQPRSTPALSPGFVTGEVVEAHPVPGALHHDYRCAA